MEVSIVGWKWKLSLLVGTSIRAHQLPFDLIPWAFPPTWTFPPTSMETSMEVTLLLWKSVYFRWMEASTDVGCRFTSMENSMEVVGGRFSSMEASGSFHGST